MPNTKATAPRGLSSTPASLRTNKPAPATRLHSN
jgi:hypothetical protein